MVSLMNCVFNPTPKEPDYAGLWKLAYGQGPLQRGQRANLAQGKFNAYISKIERLSIMGNFAVVLTESGSTYTVEL